MAAPPRVEITTTTTTTTEKPTTLAPVETTSVEEILTTTKQAVVIDEEKITTAKAVVIDEEKITTAKPVAITEAEKIVTTIRDVPTTVKPIVVEQEDITTERDIATTIVSDIATTTVSNVATAEDDTVVDDIVTTVAPSEPVEASTEDLLIEESVELELKDPSDLQEIDLIEVEEVSSSDDDENLFFNVKVSSEGEAEFDNTLTDTEEAPAEKFRQELDFEHDGVARKEVILDDGSIRGMYSYRDPHGELVVVHYIAGENGFQIINSEDNKEQSRSPAAAPAPVAAPPAPAFKPLIPRLDPAEIFARTASPRRRSTTTTTTTP